MEHVESIVRCSRCDQTFMELDEGLNLPPHDCVPTLRQCHCYDKDPVGTAIETMPGTRDICPICTGKIGPIGPALCLAKEEEEVNCPDHYMTGGYECFDIIAALGLCYWGGNVLKYLWRYEDKGDPVGDLKKCRSYLDYLIKKEEKKCLGAETVIP